MIESILRFFCKKFKCRSTCVFNDEIDEAKKYIKKLDLDDLKDIIDFHKEKEIIFKEHSNEIKKRFSQICKETLLEKQQIIKSTMI